MMKLALHFLPFRPVVAAAILSVASALFATPALSAGAEGRLGLGQLMDLCEPLTTTGPDVRDAMAANGWTETAPDARREVLRDLVAAHLWSFLPDFAPKKRRDAFDRLLGGVTRAANGETGTVLAKEDGQRALLLWNGENLSCLWAGPRSEETDLLAGSLGGFPETDGTAVTSRVRMEDIDDRRWRRRTAFARIPKSESLGPLEDSALFERAPKGQVP